MPGGLGFGAVVPVFGVAKEEKLLLFFIVAPLRKQVPKSSIQHGTREPSVLEDVGV